MTGTSSPTVGQVAAQRGTTVTCAANRPAEMDDPEYAWFIESGAVDLFLVEMQDGVERSAPQHMVRAGAGRLLPGVAPQHDETSLILMAKGLPGTVLRRISRSQLGTVGSVEVAEQIDAWIADISAMLVRGYRPRPRINALLESGEAPAMRSGTIAARRGVVWAAGLSSGEGLFMGLIDLAASRAAPDGTRGSLPLTSATWLAVTQEARVTPVSSSELAERGQLLSGLDAFHQVALSLERLNRQLALVGQANLARAQAISRRDGEEAARHRLFDALRSPGLHTEVDDSGRRSDHLERRARRSPASESQADDSGRRSDRPGRRSPAGESQVDDSGLHRVLRVIGRHSGIEFRRPSSPSPSDQSAAHSELDRVLNASDARSRKVKLVPQDRWWVGDSGAMLAFRAEDGRPVALVPGALGNYREVDPASRRRRRITAANAGSLRPDAFTFYPGLKPADVDWRDLWDVARTGLGGLLARLAVTGLLGGLIMLLPAVALGFAADEAIPAGDAGLLYGVSLALVAFGIARALLYVLQDMSLMGIEARVSSRMEAAFWDRLLRLPASVRRQYPSGELAARGTTFQNVRDAAHGVIGNGLLSTLFLVPAFVLIAWRDVWLGGLTAAFGFLSLLVTTALGLRQIGPLDRQMKAVQLMASRLSQLINGIPRMRMHGAESSGFAVWARGYREQKRTEMEFDAMETHLRAFGAALPSLAAALVILVATLLGPGSLSAGDFIVVFVLFLLYQRAVKRLGESFGALAAVVPAWNQLRPLLAEATETGAEKDFVEELHGEVVFDKVSFRYEANGPLVLDDVSIRVSKGEFVALVGESGSGKSTLLRLALGLERPFSGSVCFDGRDLQHLDPKSVRRQIGVVPQVVQLHPADLWDNIVGGDERFTSEDAWRAAQLAAVDREIMAMPMGMLTPIGAGAAVISGGESQRIQIAHALIRDPRILILDEATSWLDTETQSRILENLSSLTSTRIVVAHRRSTLQHVDRIYVLQQGKVVQEGSFAELAENPGVFQDLMSRQQAA